MSFTKFKMSIRNPPMFGYYNVPNTRLASSHHKNVMMKSSTEPSLGRRTDILAPMALKHPTKATTSSLRTDNCRKGPPSEAMALALRTVEMKHFQEVHNNANTYPKKVFHDEMSLRTDNPQRGSSLGATTQSLRTDKTSAKPMSYPTKAPPFGVRTDNPQCGLSLGARALPLRTDNGQQVKLWENGIPSEYNKLVTPNDITKILFLATGSVYKINEQNLELYQTAFVHKSFMKCFGYQPIGNQVHNPVYSYKPNYSYERQEYVGDRVIDLVVAEYLFERYPKKAEGFMTDMKKKLVKNQTLKNFGAFLGFAEYILLSDHIEKIGGRNNSKQFLANIFEAFCYAVKKDQGLEVAEKFIIGVIEKNVNFEELEHNNDNYKDILLRLFQKKKWGFPTYSIINKTGPGHNMQFSVGVDFIQHINGVPTKIDGKYFGVGNDRCKKGAEQIASKITIEMLTKK